MHWSLEQVRLDALVEETVDAMRPAAAAGSVAVTTELDPAIPTAHANPEHLQRVLFNLIQNAIRHTPPDGAVTVRARRAGPEVELEVADTGDGISSEDRARVFEPFVRVGADAARSRDGAGLGLAIARAIVEAHGGRIWIADRDPGVAFCFTVPAAP